MLVEIWIILIFPTEEISKSYFIVEGQWRNVCKGL